MFSVLLNSLFQCFYGNVGTTTVYKGDLFVYHHFLMILNVTILYTCYKLRQGNILFFIYLLEVESF